MATAEELLALARREIGTRERPFGSNRVSYNTAYYGREVQGAGYPWCCVFLWWLFQKADASALFYGGGKTASCGTLADYAKREGLWIGGKYRAGDLAFFHFGGRTIRHIGIVERVTGAGELVTIEGNTGVGNDANGGQVQRRVRRLADTAGGYRPNYEEATMTQQEFNERMESWLTQRAGQEASAFSAEARAWAESCGLIRGDEQGRMQYKSFCTREQLMTFLYRLSGKKE